MAQTQNILLWIQDWFSIQCDGIWEHSYGVKIDTLDNPGWSVVIDLKNTVLENMPMKPVLNEQADNDWVNCSIVEKQFRGFGGSQNLSEILEVFYEFAKENTKV